jgi:hypothetical protein
MGFESSVNLQANWLQVSSLQRTLALDMLE